MIDFEETQKMVAAMETVLSATTTYTDIRSAASMMERYRPSVVLYGKLRTIGYSSSDATGLMKLFESIDEKAINMKNTTALHLMRVFKYGMDKGIRVRYNNQGTDAEFSEMDFDDLSNKYTEGQMEEITTTIGRAIECAFTVCF
jgi:hypothetical protein